MSGPYVQVNLAEEGPHAAADRAQHRAPGEETTVLSYRAMLAAAVAAALLAVGAFVVAKPGGEQFIDVDVETSLALNLRELNNSKFVSSSSVMKLNWLKEGEGDLKTVMENSFGEVKYFWKTWFEESHPKKKMVDGEKLLHWVNNDLLAHDPFEDGGKVPVPSQNFSKNGQLQPGEYVGYTRRQLCYIVARSMKGGTLKGYDNGLTSYLYQKGADGCAPLTDDFGKSMWGLLAACAADPTLEGGRQGPMLLVVKPKAASNGESDIAKLLEVADRISLVKAGFRICRYDDGSVYKQAWLPGVPRSPDGLCRQPTDREKGVDYFSSEWNHQAAVDPSEKFVGGSIFGIKCGASGSADEYLTQFMPEVAALTLFLAQGNTQMSVPLWILGARTIMSGLDGTARFVNMSPDGKTKFTSDLKTVTLHGESVTISTSKPFVAIGSKMQGQIPFESGEEQKARINRHPNQREYRHGSAHSFAAQIQAWYKGMALSSIPSQLHGVMRTVVKSIGTGPWSSGLAFGDSQLDLLAIWIGQALAAESWGDGGLLTDYYLYSGYMENPGNQCFLHSASRCGDCLWTCDHQTFPAGSVSLPEGAYFTMDKKRPCVINSNYACPYHGIENVMWNFGFLHAGQLWRKVEEALASDQRPSRPVFDELMDVYTKEKLKAMDPYASVSEGA